MHGFSVMAVLLLFSIGPAAKLPTRVQCDQRAMRVLAAARSSPTRTDSCRCRSDVTTQPPFRSQATK